MSGDGSEFAKAVAAEIVRIAERDRGSTVVPIAAWTLGSRLFLVFRSAINPDRVCGWTEDVYDPEVMVVGTWNDHLEAAAILYYNNIDSMLTADMFRAELRWTGSSDDVSGVALPQSVEDLVPATLIPPDGECP